MEADTVTTPRENEPGRSQATPCPLCGGPLQDLRGLLQCCRCFFAICESCEGGAAE